MSCYHPRTAWYSKVVNPSGKRSLVFAEHLSDGGPPIEVPCRHCVGCRLDRAQQWSSRLMHEKLDFDEASFITLSYNKENLPEHGQLVPRHIQLFMKRLRKKHPDLLIRFFAAGEYGEQTFRPHYHLIIYGYAFLKDRRAYKKNDQGDQLYSSKELDDLWGKGNCYIGNVTQQSCEYVARYCMKKVYGDLAEEHYARVDETTGEWYMLHPEFVRMSRRPGIGHSFFDKYFEQVYRRGSIIVKGKECKVPDYYDRLLAKVDPILLESVKFDRYTEGKLHKDDNTPERLLVKETIRKDRVKRLGRGL